MDELKDKISVAVCKADSEIVVKTLLPVSRFVDTDVAVIFSYLASRYDVSSFHVSICDGNRSVIFRLKDCWFDDKKFGILLLSL